MPQLSRGHCNRLEVRLAETTSQEALSVCRDLSRAEVRQACPGLRYCGSVQWFAIGIYLYIKDALVIHPRGAACGRSGNWRARIQWGIILINEGWELQFAPARD